MNYNVTNTIQVSQQLTGTPTYDLVQGIPDHAIVRSLVLYSRAGNAFTYKYDSASATEYGSVPAGSSLDLKNMAKGPYFSIYVSGTASDYIDGEYGV